jgi:hypothetical protein
MHISTDNCKDQKTLLCYMKEKYLVYTCIHFVNRPRHKEIIILRITLYCSILLHHLDLTLCFTFVVYVQLQLMYTLLFFIVNHCMFRPK